MEQRVPPYRPPARSKRPSSRTAIMLILVFFFGVLSVLFLKSPLGKINEIKWVGNHLIPDQELLKISGLKEGGSYFRLHVAKTEQRLQQIPEVQGVTITKTFPGRVQVRIREVKRIGYLDHGSNLYPVLQDGSVLKNRPWRGSVDRPLFRGWSKLRIWDELAEGLTHTPKRILDDISEIRPGGNDTYPDLVKVYTRHGHIIRIRAMDFGQKIRLYAAFRNHPSGTLNLLESTWFVPKKNKQREVESSFSGQKVEWEKGENSPDVEYLW